MLSRNADIPDVTVATMEGDEIISHNLPSLFEDGLYVLVGVPGAFTPICTQHHLPTLIASADKLKGMGVKEIYCISDDNPWALHAWQQTFPDHEKIVFLCDGNRDFLKASGMATHHPDLFLNGKYGRFYAIVRDRKIRRVRFETSVLNTVCTNGESIEEDVSSFLSQ